LHEGIVPKQLLTGASLPKKFAELRWLLWVAELEVLALGTAVFHKHEGLLLAGEKVDLEGLADHHSENGLQEGFFCTTKGFNSVLAGVYIHQGLTLLMPCFPRTA
jgi:hypothetical protein